jgi:predicted nucleic acid-binding protein
MALICDTGGVYALYDADDVHHANTKAALQIDTGPRLVPIVLMAEIDLLLTAHLGVDAALDFIRSVEAGAFPLAGMSAEDLTGCRELITQYRDLGIGLADASVVATAER